MPRTDKFVPARVLNMIAFVDRQWTGEIANRLSGVGRYPTPRGMLVLAYEPRRERLDARVTIAAEGDPDAGEACAAPRVRSSSRSASTILDDLLTNRRSTGRDRPAHSSCGSPHGHEDVVQVAAGPMPGGARDSVDEPVAARRSERACLLSDRDYVVDLAWLRSTPPA